MSRKLIRLQTSISQSRYFETQKEVSEFLGIVNYSKKAINTRIKKFDYEVEYPEKETTRRQILTKSR